MKLFFAKGTCSLVIRIVQHELGVSSEYEAVDLKTKQTESGADYLKINPKGAVPALLIGPNNLLTENSAIQQYLADTYHGAHLLPPVGDERRYRVIEWLSFIGTDLHKSCSPIFNPNVTEDMKSQVFRPLLKSKFSYADQALKDSPYLLGEQFTLPDAYLFVVLSWIPRLGLDLVDFPSLNKYFLELKGRKAIALSLQEEGLTL